MRSPSYTGFDTHYACGLSCTFQLISIFACISATHASAHTRRCPHAALPIISIFMFSPTRTRLNPCAPLPRSSLPARGPTHAHLCLHVSPGPSLPTRGFRAATSFSPGSDAVAAKDCASACEQAEIEAPAPPSGRMPRSRRTPNPDVHALITRIDSFSRCINASKHALARFLAASSIKVANSGSTDPELAENDAPPCKVSVFWQQPRQYLGKGANAPSATTHAATDVYATTNARRQLCAAATSHELATASKHTKRGPVAPFSATAYATTAAPATATTTRSAVTALAAATTLAMATRGRRPAAPTLP